MKNKFPKRILRQEKYRSQEGKVGPNDSKIKNTSRAGSGVKKDYHQVMRGINGGQDY